MYRSIGMVIFRRRSRLLIQTAMAAAASVIAFGVVAPQPAQADPISAFTTFYGYLKQGYDLYNRYLANRQPSEIARLEEAVRQSRNDIVDLIDRTQVGEINSCTATTLDRMYTLNVDNTTDVESVKNLALACLNDAQQRIDSTDGGKAKNMVGIGFNTVAPITLMLYARLDLDATLIRQHVLEANTRLRQVLAPICGVTIDEPANLPTGSGPITGRGVCYNYLAQPAEIIRRGNWGGIWYVSRNGPGKAFLSWPVRGWAQVDDWARPDGPMTVRFGPAPDVSIARNEVMRGTSWEVAGTVLDLFAPTFGPPSAPVAGVVNKDISYNAAQIIGVNAAEQVFLGGIDIRPIDRPFTRWAQMDGSLRSVAAAANADGRAEFFGVSRTGTIYHRWQQTAGDDTTWSSWAEMPGKLNSITAAPNANGTLQAFGTNAAGQFWTAHQILGGDQEERVQPVHPVPAINTWTSWQPMSWSGVMTQVSAVTDVDKLIHVYGINTAGQLLHRHQLYRDADDPTVPGSWTEWEQLPAPAPLRSIAAAKGFGGKVIFATTDADHIWTTVNYVADGPGAVDWTELPGRAHSVAAFKEGGEADIVVLAVDPNGVVSKGLHNGSFTWRPGGWRANGLSQDWSPLPGLLRPAAPR